MEIIYRVVADLTSKEFLIEALKEILVFVWQITLIVILVCAGIWFIEYAREQIRRYIKEVATEK